MSLKGKFALVTGAAGGIGMSVTEKLSDAGCQVMATDMIDKDEATNKMAEIQDVYEISYIRCDLRRHEDIGELCKELETICPQGIDIFVNVAVIWWRPVFVGGGENPNTMYPERDHRPSASIILQEENYSKKHLNSWQLIKEKIEQYDFEALSIKLLENMSTEEWNAELDVNLTAPFVLTKHVLPSMKKKKWGRIVNVSSVFGIVASPGFAAYNASKTGLLGLTRAIALETAEYGITCNALCPGAIDTPLLHGSFHQFAEVYKSTYDELKENMKNRIPTKTFSDVSEVSSLVLFLCSPAADNLTGTSIPVEGGYVAQ